MLQKYLLQFFFFLPIGFSLVIFIPFSLSVLGLETPIMWGDWYLWIWILGIGLFATMTLYVFIVFRLLLSFTKRWKNRKNDMDALYKQYEMLIILGTVLSSAVLCMFFISMFFPMVTSSYELWQLILILFALFTSSILIFLVAKFPYKRIGNSIVILSLTILLGVIGYFLLGIYEEFSPNYYLTFPLNDPKGVYIINYDGDYWVTYYTQKQQCTTVSGKKNCTYAYVNTGNTAITSSPVDLKPFIDTHVRITGTFQKIYSSVFGAEKKLCIGKGFFLSCHVSAGPGVWYASPLQLEAIEKAE